MNTLDIEKLNQLISRTDISGNDKVQWLTDYIEGREHVLYDSDEVLEILRDFQKESFTQTINYKRWFNKFYNKSFS